MPLLALGIGFIFPTLLGAVEFIAAPSARSGHNPLAQLAYGFCQLLMLAWPLAYCWLFEGRFPRPAAPSRAGLALGLGFGTIAAAGALGLYFGWLRDTLLFQGSGLKVHAKLHEFGLDSPTGFAVFAFFVAVAHSALEEYYWRWFLFGRLRRYVPPAWAAGLSSVAFMIPHVFPLATFLGTEFVLAVAAFTLCVGVGGAAWCWLFHRSGSLYACWLSHLIVDLAVFVVAYDLFFAK